MYTLEDFISKFDINGEIKKSIGTCISNNMTKEIAIDMLVDDLQKRLYDFIWESNDLDIDDGSNVERGFKDAIKIILTEYFKRT